MAKGNWQDQCRKKQRFWKTHIEAWQKSSLAQNEYCRQHNLIKHRFGYWKRKLTDMSNQSNVPRFVPVALAPSVPKYDHSDSGIEILIGNIKIKLTNSFNAQTLLRTINTLGGKS